MRERNRLDSQISKVREVEQSLNDNIELISLGEEEGDEAIVAESEAALESMKKQVEKQQLESLLSGEVDGNDCYLQVNAGAGGTEALQEQSVYC